jgi:hypothetical protein
MLVAACAGVSAFAAEETNAPPATTNAPAAIEPASPPLTQAEMFEGGKEPYNNWIEFSAGGFLINGNHSQFQERHRSREVFGGIEDFHYSAKIATNTTLTADGRALFDNHDYKLRLDVTKEKLGYVRLSYNEFRTWYNGDGGFYQNTGSWFPLQEDALALDRGEISFEAGLTLEKVPKITFKYTHQFRVGDKNSTSWGQTHPGGVTRNLSPSFYDIDEHRDIFELDATHHIKKTDLGLGLRYETGKFDDALKIDHGPGEPVEQRITDRQGTTYDLFNVHAFTETWLNKRLLLSSGYSFSDLDNNFSGSRIYGTDFDVGYVPSATDGAGYFGLNGGSQMQEYVMNVNLFYKVSEHFCIIPSVRAQKEDADADSAGSQTSGGVITPFSARSDRELLDVRERLDLRYTGITNWVLYGRGEWTEGDGNLNEFGGVTVPGPATINRETEDSRFFQKYSAGARWYPTRRVTVDAGGYYKLNNYDYDNRFDSTANTGGNRYPAYLVMQNFETYDGNLRLTLRPWQNVTLVSQYDYQLSTIHTQPDPISGLSEVESSQMKTHIIGQSISYSPWSRLYLQVGFNYVLSKTETPASDFTQAVLDAQNNYWTLNFSSGLVLDDKTDLNVGYFYYQADNYRDITPLAVPYGAGAEEHGITATLTRRLTKNLRLTLKYGFFNYDDATFGGNRNYQAHTLYTSLQYRF